ncbi:hypothetical protein ACFQ6H_27330 [Rhodococcus sp. NPDC056506]|uniref:hypothetical protein n=1 Tax=Rhodococcus sp. NPDC056506 TaxID=3345844 RepID=UPI0036724E2C
MSDLVFWQKPGENYVRVGEAKGFRYADRLDLSEWDPFYQPTSWFDSTCGARLLLDRVCDVKRHGRIETVSVASLREVGSRD